MVIQEETELREQAARFHNSYYAKPMTNPSEIWLIDNLAHCGHNDHKRYSKCEILWGRVSLRLA
jgi:hypothetical protein